ncbi:MAG: hypothetical protein DMG73_11955, partial [Acidobacteria bacterium]
MPRSCYRQSPVAIATKSAVRKCQPETTLRRSKKHQGLCGWAYLAHFSLTTWTRNIDEALAVITKLSAGVREITFPVATDRTVQTAESYAYHAKSVAQAPELYQPETLRRIRAGANVSAADYIHRRRELDEARRAITSVFDSVDLLVTPTIPTPPPIIADLKENPDLLRPCEILMLRNTRPVNVWGVPAIS